MFKLTPKCLLFLSEKPKVHLLGCKVTNQQSRGTFELIFSCFFDGCVLTKIFSCNFTLAFFFFNFLYFFFLTLCDCVIVALYKHPQGTCAGGNQTMSAFNLYSRLSLWFICLDTRNMWFYFFVFGILRQPISKTK